MGNSLIEVVEGVTRTWPLWLLCVFFLSCGLIFGLLEYLFPARTDQEYKRESVRLDLFYWAFTPLVIKVFTNLCLAATAAVLLYCVGRPLDEHVLDGFGPLSRQPIWLQLLQVLVITDFIGYWSHRWFHVTRMWKYHAVHHSPMRLDWLSAYRMHPVNDAISRTFQSIPVLLLGYSPKIIEPFIIVIVVYVVFLHTNVRWTWGPLKYVLSSPTFHRWHHTSEPEGLDKNYAILFPFWDVLFGTFFFPNRQPCCYGVKGNSVPETFVGQMLHPFVYKEPQEMEAKAAGEEVAV